MVPEICNDAGFARAGVLATLVDVIGGGLAAAAAHPNWIATADLTLHTVAGAEPGTTVEARGRTLRAGRTTVVMEVDLVDDARTRTRARDDELLGAPPARREPRHPRSRRRPARPRWRLPSPGSAVRSPTCSRCACSMRRRGAIELPVTDWARNSMGAMQGGVVALVADLAAEQALRAATGRAVAVADLHSCTSASDASGRSARTSRSSPPDTARVEIIDAGRRGPPYDDCERRRTVTAYQRSRNKGATSRATSASSSARPTELTSRWARAGLAPPPRHARRRARRRAAHDARQRRRAVRRSRRAARRVGRVDEPRGAHVPHRAHRAVAHRRRSAAPRPQQRGHRGADPRRRRRRCARHRRRLDLCHPRSRERAAAVDAPARARFPASCRPSRCRRFRSGSTCGPSTTRRSRSRSPTRSGIRGASCTAGSSPRSSIWPPNTRRGGIVTDVVLHFLAPNRVGPVRAEVRVLGSRADGTICRVEVRDAGADRVTAVAIATAATR